MSKSTASRRALGTVAALAFSLLGCAAAEQPIVYHNRNPNPSELVKWPKPTGEVQVDATIRVIGGQHFDGKMKRYYGVDDMATSSQEETQDPVFRLSDGAVLENVILGDPAADGVHCYGTCTIRNVWWERVGEDAATFRGQQPDDYLLIEGGGASGAMDKVFQNNGVGTLIIKNFYVERFGKLYRSCGNCSRQAGRKVIVENVIALVDEEAECLVGLNENYGDQVVFKGLTQIYNHALKPKFPVCQRWIGNSRGLEPKKSTKGPDENCRYDETTVVIK